MRKDTIRHKAGAFIKRGNFQFQKSILKKFLNRVQPEGFLKNFFFVSCVCRRSYSFTISLLIGFASFPEE